MKSALSGHSQIEKTKGLKTNCSLMKVKSIVECSTWRILQHFWPALSHNRFWKAIISLFLSGHLRQVLLYSMFFVAIGYIHATGDMNFKQMPQYMFIT